MAIDRVLSAQQSSLCTPLVHRTEVMFCVNLDIMSGALELRGHGRVVRRLATIPTADRVTLLASGDNEGAVRVWNPASGELVTGPVTTGEIVWDLAPVGLRSGNVALAVPADDGVQLWDPLRLGDRNGLLRQVRVEAATALAVIPATATTPDLLVVAGNDDVRVVDPNTGDSLARFPQPSGTAREFGHHRVRRVTGGTFEGDKPVFVTERFASVPELWTRRVRKLPGRRHVWRRSRLNHSNPDGGGVALLTGSAGEPLIAVAEHRRVELWEARTKQLRTAVEADARVTALATLSDQGGTALVVGCTGERESAVSIWDWEHGRWWRTVNHHDAALGVATSEIAPEIRAVTAVPSRQGSVRVASAANDGAVCVSEPIAV